MYPFLFRVLDSMEFENYHYIVVMADFNYQAETTFWMADKELPAGRCCSPSIDIKQNSFSFKLEEDALTFIRQWWIDHPIS